MKAHSGLIKGNPKLLTDLERLSSHYNSLHGFKSPAYIHAHLSEIKKLKWRAEMTNKYKNLPEINKLALYWDTFQVISFSE